MMVLAVNDIPMRETQALAIQATLVPDVRHELPEEADLTTPRQELLEPTRRKLTLHDGT